MGILFGGAEILWGRAETAFPERIMKKRPFHPLRIKWILPLQTSLPLNTVGLLQGKGSYL